MLNKKKKRKQQDPEQWNTLQSAQHDIHSDVLGSYTGMGEEGEYPEQDADDL